MKEYGDWQGDLTVARSVQAAMIPRSLPSIDGVDMASIYVPCTSVGGDIFDVVALSDDTIAFFICDVSGHGVTSALIASMAKVSFITHLRTVTSPRSVLERVNQEMVQRLSGGHFITAFVAYLDLHNNKLTYCNAAHAYPLIYRKDKRALVSLKTSGLFVGIFDDGQYEERSVFLSPGDWLLLFSNGLYALFDPENGLAGRRMLEEQVIGRIEAGSPASLVAWLEGQRRVCEAALDDDVGVVAVEILTQSRKSQIKEKLGFGAGDPVYLQFVSYFEEMDKAASAVLREMDEYGYPDDGIRKMKIALTELLANAICHGNRKDHSKKVTMGHLVKKDDVMVSIMDEGSGFDVGDIPDPTLPENLEKDCGRGLYIVRNYVDKMEFNETGNRVTIWKFHPGEGAEAGPNAA